MACDCRGHAAICHDDRDLVTLEAIFLVFSPCHFKTGNVWELNNRASRADWKLTLHHRNYFTFPKNVQTGLSIPNYAIKEEKLDEAVKVNRTAVKVVAKTSEVIQTRTAERPTLLAIRLKDKEEKATAAKIKLVGEEQQKKDLAAAAEARLTKSKAAPGAAATASKGPTSTITKPVEPMETDCNGSDLTPEMIAAGFSLAEIQAVFIAACIREHGVSQILNV